MLICVPMSTYNAPSGLDNHLENAQHSPITYWNTWSLCFISWAKKKQKNTESPVIHFTVIAFWLKWFLIGGALQEAEIHHLHFSFLHSNLLSPYFQNTHDIAGNDAAGSNSRGKELLRFEKRISYTLRWSAISSRISPPMGDAHSSLV